MKDKILKCFRNLCLKHKRFLGEESSDKLKALENILKDLNIPYEYAENIGLIVNKQKKPNKVIVSHMDLIPLFQNGFQEDRVCKITEQCVIGALDNTITNAILILVIKKLSEENKLDNIEFLFSEAEEIGFIGVSNYLEEYKDKFQETFFINLDVTNEGYKQDASIEYDNCNFENLKKIQNIENQDFFYTMNREGDDMCAILKKGFHGFSYCLPTKNNIHSYKNKARLSSLEKYYNGLLKIIDIEICSYDNNVEEFQFKSALKNDNIKDLKRIKKISAKRRYYPEEHMLDYMYEEKEDKDILEWSLALSDKEIETESKNKADKFCNAVYYEMEDSNNEKIRKLYRSDYFKSTFFEVVLMSFKENFLSYSNFIFTVSEDEELLEDLFNFLMDKDFIVYSRIDKDIYFFSQEYTII